MTVEIPAEDLSRWHRHFAVTMFNRSWELLDLSDARTADDDDELLAVVFGSRWHWGHAGGEEEKAVGDHQIGNACSQLGLGSLALRFARQALTRTEANGWGGWRLASCYEGMARAAAVAGDAAERERWLTRATEALDDISDPEERATIAEQVASVPEASGR